MRLIILYVFVLSISISIQAIADQTQTKSLNRTIDPVVVSGRECGLTGKALANYGLYAFREQKLLPVPFQIDEKNDGGEFILKNGKQLSRDSDNGLFDDNDELVFMAMDTGHKLSDKELLPKSSTACVELEITDPVTKEHAWVYFLTFDTPPEKSPVDYVFYDDRNLTFSTGNYSGQYDKKCLVGASKYAFEKGLGGNGKDFIDRIKVRIKIKSMGLTLKRSEEDITVEEEGYIDGPVRVIVHTKNNTPLVLGIPVSSTRQYIYYYDTYADFAFSASFPLKPSSFQATVVDDFIDAKGWTFYNSNNPFGHIIDGKMDAKDKSLDLSPWTWSVLTKDNLSFWSVWKAPKGCPVKASLYFKDDSDAWDKMENNKGELPGIGFDFNTGWNELQEDSVELRLIHFYTSGYEKGMEKNILNVQDAPLVVYSNAF